MPQKFRLTCARTSYFEVELEADERVAAEQQFAAILEQNPELWKQVEAVGRPVYRLVDVDSGVQESAAPGALTPRAAA